VTQIAEAGHAAGPSAAGSVVLDIGSQTGALVLFVPASLSGVEIEISIAADPVATRTHSRVRKRDCAGPASSPASGAASGRASGAASDPGSSAGNGRGSGPGNGPGSGAGDGPRSGPGGSSVSYAAVYPGLVAGTYTIWRDTRTPAGTVEIGGGKVTTWHWPTAGP
jgi:hypothetical protein